MKILIADDDAMSRRLLEQTLIRLGHEVVAVADGPSAVTALLAPNAPRLAVLDWMMPGADGLAVCKEVRQSGESYAYIILLTARDGREDMVSALDAGVDDFLTKPLDPVELRARLHSGERVVALQARLLETQAALRFQATHDELTGLWNRRMIIEQLDRELRRAAFDARPVSVALADLDHFKQVNDLGGHAAGDTFLRAAAERFRDVLRPSDNVGRYGGEEFLLLLLNCDRDSARTAAERARQAIAATPLRGPGLEALTASASFGIACTNETGYDSAMLIKRADEALYRAKAAGRNRVEA
jgi:two-component system, cell cycle response regulator